MKVFMIGEAANHKEKLAAGLPNDWTLVGLPREAAYSDQFDADIGRDDVVISLRFARRNGPAPAVRLLHVPGAGLDGIDLDTLSPATTVCNVFEHEIAIGEFVLATLLDWEIRLAEMRASFSPESWSDAYRNRIPHGELHSRTIGIIGFGRIGRAIAQRARAFGMHILAVDAFATDTGGLADRVLPPSDLPAVLREADYLVIACPLTEETRGLIDAQALAAMKPGAFFINISRAEIADEDALYEALANRTIAGAALDVWYTYPKGADDQVAPSRRPFHALPNVYCTPHSCAWTTSLPGRRYAFIARNLIRFARGEPLLNVVRAPAA